MSFVAMAPKGKPPSKPKALRHVLGKAKSGGSPGKHIKKRPAACQVPALSSVPSSTLALAGPVVVATDALQPAQLDITADWLQLPLSFAMVARALDSLQFPTQERRANCKYAPDQAGW